MQPTGRIKIVRQSPHVGQCCPPHLREGHNADTLTGARASRGPSAAMASRPVPPDIPRALTTAADAERITPGHAPSRRQPTRERRKLITNTTIGCFAGAAGGSASHAFGESVLVSLLILGFGMLGLTAVILLPAVLGSRDARPPLDRLMLLACVILKRPPATYLPQQTPPEQPAVPRSGRQASPREGEGR